MIQADFYAPENTSLTINDFGKFRFDSHTLSLVRLAGLGGNWLPRRFAATGGYTCSLLSS